MRDYSLNETEYLIYQIRTFLDQGNYDNQQLANLTALMDDVCRSDIDQSYPISVNIDVNKFGNNNTEGKANRCQAIDDALDSMFYVFKRAALNRSEPLDFSVIQYYPNATDTTKFYNLTDLINTSWIKSETLLEHVCNITDSVKRYVQARVMASSNSNSSAEQQHSARAGAADKRNEQPARVGVFTTIFDMIDRILDPLLGLQKRLMWESNNRLEMVGNRLSSGLGAVRDGFGSRIKSTRDRFSGLFSSSSANSTTLANSNATKALNSTSFNAAANASRPTNGSPSSLMGVALNASSSASTSNSFNATQLPSTQLAGGRPTGVSAASSSASAAQKPNKPAPVNSGLLPTNSLN